MSRPGFASYRGVLAVPGAAAFSVAGAVARLPQSMEGLGATLMVVGIGRSYALAGLVAAATAVPQGLTAPLLARWADRQGQSRVLVPLVVVHALALGALVVAGWREDAGWVLVLLATLAGASFPQIGAMTRARWTALLAGQPALDTALAVEGLIDELVFVVGPVVATLLVTAVAPTAALVASLLLVVVGSAMLVARRDTEPPSRRDARDDGHDDGGRRAPASALHYRGMLVLATCFVGMGAVFGSVEVTVVAFARAEGRAGWAGVALALWAAGSLAAGVLFGASRWTASARRGFLLATAGLAVGTVLVAVSAWSLASATVALVVAGLANAPTLISGQVLVPSIVPASVTTEAYTWLAVAIVLGAAAAAPLAGLAIDHASPRAAFGVAAAVGVGTALVAAAGAHRLPATAGRRGPVGAEGPA